MKKNHLIFLKKFFYFIRKNYFKNIFKFKQKNKNFFKNNKKIFKFQFLKIFLIKNKCLNRNLLLVMLKILKILEIFLIKIYDKNTIVLFLKQIKNFIYKNFYSSNLEKNLNKLFQIIKNTNILKKFLFVLKKLYFKFKISQILLEKHFYPIFKIFNKLNLNLNFFFFKKNFNFFNYYFFFIKSLENLLLLIFYKQIFKKSNIITLYFK
jgi:hypothetical protein